MKREKKEQKQTNKVKGDEQMDANIEKLGLKEINSSQSSSSSDEENDQMKKQSKMTRRPKSGKSL